MYSLQPVPVPLGHDLCFRRETTTDLLLSVAKWRSWKRYLSLFTVWVLMQNCWPAQVQAQPLEAMPSLLEALVGRWNKGVDRHNATMLAPAYAEEVRLNGAVLDRNAVLDAKRQFFYKFPGYRQWVGEVDEVRVINGVYRTYFETTGLQNGKSIVTRTYLGFQAMPDGELRIVEEGTDEAIVEEHQGWSYEKMGKRKYCFITLGKVLKKDALPADFEQEYHIRLGENYKLSGSGKLISPISRSEYRMKIRGQLDGKGVLELDIVYVNETYDAETNPEARYETHQRWKFNGEGLGWIGGDRPLVLYMGLYHCD